MSNEFSLTAETRSDLGKGASRRLRRLEARVPAILYGGNQEPTPISILSKEINKAVENEAFYSHVLTLNLDGTEVKAVLKDLQRHPAKNLVVHADFQRIDDTHKINMHVPLHFINEDKCVGVKQQGGTISHLIAEVLVSCLAKDLPEYLEVDLGPLKAGTTLHLSDIPLPEGVELVELSHGEDHDLPVAAVNLPRGASSDAEEGDEEA